MQWLKKHEHVSQVGLCQLSSPPLTNPLVAIAEVDNPVIVVTTVAIAITRTERPLKEKTWKQLRTLFILLNLSLPRTGWANTEITLWTGVLNEKGPHRLAYLNVWFLVGELCGKGQRCGLVGGCVSLGVGFEVSKAYTRPSLTLNAFCMWII